MKKKPVTKQVKKTSMDYKPDTAETYDILDRNFDTTTQYGKIRDELEKKKKSSDIINGN